MRRFQNQGWELIKVLHYEQGHLARKVEKSVFKIIRQELKIPSYLSKEVMKKYQGETETFSADSITPRKVIQILKLADRQVMGLK